MQLQRCPSSPCLGSFPFLSLRRGERWLGEAETEWGKAFADAQSPQDRHNLTSKRPQARGEGRPPLRRASLDTSPPIDGGEEGQG
ncbi:hypothetical protein EN925_09850, partial [Mesorhizobium sp. M7A.F.Ca.US.006.04.2.1]